MFIKHRNRTKTAKYLPTDRASKSWDMVEKHDKETERLVQFHTFTGLNEPLLPLISCPVIEAKE